MPGVTVLKGHRFRNPTLTERNLWALGLKGAGLHLPILSLPSVLGLQPPPICLSSHGTSWNWWGNRGGKGGSSRLRGASNTACLGTMLYF